MIYKTYKKLFSPSGLLTSMKSLNCSRKLEFCTVSLPQKIPNNNVTEEFVKLKQLRLKYPDFIPCSKPETRSFIREKLEHLDMMRRRFVVTIPEFYVGSIVSVNSSDPHSPGKSTRFLGICIYQGGYGLGSKFILRNVIDGEGVEVMYLMYSPTIQKIDVIKLEKRLDSELFYLRDAPLEYSTFPFNMDVEFRDPNDPVPVNTLNVKLNPPPWLQKYERMNLQGVTLPPLTEKRIKNINKGAKPWEKYDLMLSYRNTIPEEEQQQIFSEISASLEELETKYTSEKKKKSFIKPKQKLF